MPVQRKVLWAWISLHLASGSSPVAGSQRRSPHDGGQCEPDRFSGFLQRCLREVVVVGAVSFFGLSSSASGDVVSKQPAPDGDRLGTLSAAERAPARRFPPRLQTSDVGLLLAAADPLAPPTESRSKEPLDVDGRAGKKGLPEGFVKSAGDVATTLRRSLDVGPSEEGFRKRAEAAKEAIRSFIVNWRGQASVTAEESYVTLETVLRELSKFYSSNGPQAKIPPDVKARLLGELDRLNAAL